MGSKKKNKLLVMTNKIANFILAKEIKGEIKEEVANKLLDMVHDLEKEEASLIKGLTDIKHLHI